MVLCMQERSQGLPFKSCSCLSPSRICMPTGADNHLLSCHPASAATDGSCHSASRMAFILHGQLSAACWLAGRKKKGNQQTLPTVHSQFCSSMAFTDQGLWTASNETKSNQTMLFSNSKTKMFLPATLLAVAALLLSTSASCMLDCCTWSGCQRLSASAEQENCHGLPFCTMGTDNSCWTTGEGNQQLRIRIVCAIVTVPRWQWMLTPILLSCVCFVSGLLLQHGQLNAAPMSCCGNPDKWCQCCDSACQVPAVADCQSTEEGCFDHPDCPHAAKQDRSNTCEHPPTLAPTAVPTAAPTAAPICECLNHTCPWDSAESGWPAPTSACSRRRAMQTMKSKLVPTMLAVSNLFGNFVMAKWDNFLSILSSMLSESKFLVRETTIRTCTVSATGKRHFVERATLMPAMDILSCVFLTLVKQNTWQPQWSRRTSLVVKWWKGSLGLRMKQMRKRWSLNPLMSDAAHALTAWCHFLRSFLKPKEGLVCGVKMQCSWCLQNQSDRLRATNDKFWSVPPASWAFLVTLLLGRATECVWFRTCLVEEDRKWSNLWHWRGGNWSWPKNLCDNVLAAAS